MKAVSNIDHYMQDLGQRASKASQLLGRADTALKNRALLEIADRIESQHTALMHENQRDLDAGKANGLDSALLDRLAFNAERIEAMAEGLREVAALADPVGIISDLCYRPSGIQVGRMRVPLGVIGIIYESRPNVTVDAAALCLKSGNAAILRGGSEAMHSNQALATCIREGLLACGLTADAVQVIATTDRAAVGALLRMKDHVDVIVPRGGKGLIQRVSEESLIPVIKHLDGVCHIFVDQTADLDQAVEVIVNAKTQRYGTCNTLETLLIEQSVATEILPRLRVIFDAKHVELRGCQDCCAILPGIVTACEQDWYAEYLAPILSIKIVPGLDEAIEHINHYGSHHTDSILTRDYASSRRFLREVDSSSVMVNASTRFADGFEYGLGAEIGISTDKLHARGPVGLEGLTTLKFIVLGNGHTRT